ncbi:MAG: prepilin-type N-terminal cleavage/methylation domain-containing protein [Muribaculaceae bacterium]|nr:prepilin-type N-terminal cleavage/methylation domain-containing protein [Muribaculaceae bacterium]
MKKEMNNKGFSLVELIIVIAIMVILVAVLAPQYLKYVEKSRVSTDVQTTVELINSLQVLASDPDVTLSTTETYTVTNGTAGSDTITISGDLANQLTTAGMLAASDMTASGSNFTLNSTYQSSVYTSTAITLTLSYSSNNIWTVTTTGVDSSGKIPTTTPAGP